MASRKLSDVRRTEAELKRHEAEDRARWSSVERQGIHVNVDHDHLRKMGHKTPPKVGSHVELHAKARVKHVRTHHDEHGHPRHHVELEITHAAMKPHDGKRDIKDVLDEALTQHADAEAGNYSAGAAGGSDEEGNAE